MKFKIYKYIFVLIALSFFTSCDFFSKKNQQQSVVEGEVEIIGLDLLPMYGSTAEYGGHKKTSDQQEADKQFLVNSDQTQPSRVQACKDYIEYGWYYLGQGDTDMAMRRANHAWQLDGTNPDVYGLFAAILNAQGDSRGAIDMLDRGITISPGHIVLYDMFLSESIDIYRQTGDDINVRKLLKHLENIHVEEDSVKIKINKIRQDAREFLKF